MLRPKEDGSYTDRIYKCRAMRYTYIRGKGDTKGIDTTNLNDLNTYIKMLKRYSRAS